MKICSLIYKKNYGRDTIYYIQETKTAFEKSFKLILKEIMLLVFSTGKRQIRTSTDVSRTNNKRCHKRSLSKKPQRKTQGANQSQCKV